MPRFDSTATLLIDRAFDLALFLHPDPAVATQVVTEAMSRLHVAAGAQRRRRRYTPRGQRGAEGRLPARRTRISLSEAHLLQRLVYIASEPFERVQESPLGGARLSERDFLVRYVKHLVRIGFKRSAFYVNLGVSRLLYSYTTGESMDIYGLVVQDPDRVRDDYYYRSRKKQLMAELGKRFGDLLSVVRERRGELRFRTRTATTALNQLVEDCLKHFTPWDTACQLPEDLDPLRTELPALTAPDDHPDSEHTTEIRRIHALLHPDCYRRLVAALGFTPPPRRLAVPCLSAAAASGEPGGGAPGPTRMGREERRRLLERLQDEARRRRRSHGRTLSLRLDGRELARLELARGDRVRLPTAEDAELLEVWDDRGTLLATCLLGGPEGCAPDSLRRCRVTLEGGQRISFAISPPNREGAGAVVEVSYRERRPWWAARLAWVRLQARLADAGAPARRGIPRALGAAMLVATAAVALILNRPPRMTPAPPATPGGEPVLTRELRLTPAGAALEEVETVFVDPLGEGIFARDLGHALAERLQTSHRFQIAAERDFADAVFKGSVEEGSAPPQIYLELVNAEGKVLWRSGRQAADGPPEDLATAIAAALAAAAPATPPP